MRSQGLALVVNSNRSRVSLPSAVGTGALLLVQILQTSKDTYVHAKCGALALGPPVFVLHRGPALALKLHTSNSHGAVHVTLWELLLIRYWTWWNEE